jgi:hypothetical protein
LRRLLMSLSEARRATGSFIGGSQKWVGLQELLRPRSATAAHTDIGPEPHPNFIDVFSDPALSRRHGEVERARGDVRALADHYVA